MTVGHTLHTCPDCGAHGEDVKFVKRGRPDMAMDVLYWNWTCMICGAKGEEVNDITFKEMRVTKPGKVVNA